MPQNLNLGLKITPEFDVKKLNAALKAMKASMGDMGKSIHLIDEKKLQNEYAKIDQQAQKAAQSSRQVSQATDKVAQSLQKAADKGTLLGKAFAFNQMVQATQALTGALQPFVQGFIDFDAGMADFSAITGIAGDALDDFGDRARALAKEFGTGIIEQVDAFKGIIARLGPAIAKSPAALEEMSKAVNTLSKASGLDAATSMDALTTAVLQFNVDLSDPVKAAGEMTKMMNTMAAGAAEGAAEIPDISATIVNAGVAASRANISFEETNAAIQVLAAGGKYGAEAGVALRNVLGYLQKASRTAGGELKKMGLTTKGLAETLTEKGLGAAIKDLKKGLNTMGSDAEKNAALMKLFGMENAAAAGILLKNADSIGDLTSKLGGTNTAFNQAAINMDTATAASDRFKAIIEDLALGAFQVLGTGAASTLKVLTEYTPALMGFMMLGQFAPGIKNTATALITKLVPAMVVTDTATQASTLSFKALSKAMLSSPIFWVVAGVAALVTAMHFLSDAFHKTAVEALGEAKALEELKNKEIEVAQKQRELAQSNLDLIDKFKKLGETTKGAVEESAGYDDMLLRLAARYPGVIDSTKSYEENLAELKEKVKETTKELKGFEDQIIKLEGERIKIEFDIAKVEVNVAKEKIEDELTDAIADMEGIDLSAKGIITGIYTGGFSQLFGTNQIATGVQEFLTGSSQARVKAEKAIYDLTSGIYKAWKDSDVDAAVVKAQMDLLNDPKFAKMDPKAKEKMLTQIEEMGEAQKKKIAKNNEKMAFEADIGITTLVGKYKDAAKKIGELEIETKAGTATEEDIKILKKLQNEQKAIGNEIQKAFQKGIDKGHSMKNTVVMITKAYGLSEEKVKEILGIQGELTDEVKKTSEGVRDLGNEFSEALTKASEKYKGDVTTAMGALKDLNEAKAKGIKKDIAAAKEKYEETLKNAKASHKEFGGLKNIEDTIKNIVEGKKKGSKHSKDSAKAAETEYQITKKLYELKKQEITLILDEKDIAAEHSRILQQREKNIIDDIAANQRKLQLLKDQKQALLDTFKITQDSEGNIAVGIKVSDEERSNIETDLTKLTNDITKETNKTLELQWKAKLDAKKMQEELDALAKEELSFEIELGIKTPEDMLALLEAKLKNIRDEIESKEASKKALQLQLTVALASGDNTAIPQLQAQIKDLDGQIVDLNKNELDGRKDVYNENKKIYDERMRQLETLHEREIADIENKIDLERRLNAIRLSITEKIFGRASDKTKDDEIAKLEKQKADELITEEQFNDRKEDVELEHHNRMKAIADAARGAELEAERQQAIQLLKEKEKRIAIELSKAQESGDTKKAGELEAQLGNIQKGIEEKGDLIQEYSGELKTNVTAIFTSLIGDEESLKEPWRQVLSVAAGGLKKYMSLLATKLVFGEVSKYAGTGLFALLLIPAFQGIVNAVLGAILNPVLSSIASFSGGGRFDEPTKVVGDNPYSPEWVFRDIDIMAMLDKQMNSFLDSMPDILNSTLDKYFSDSDITQQDMMKWSTNIRDLGVRQEKIDREIEKMQDIITEFKLKISTDTKGFFEELDKTRKINLMFLDNKITEDEYYKQIKINEIGIDSSATKDILNNLGMLKSKEILMPDLKLDTSEFAEMFGNAVMKGQAKTEKLLVEVIAAIYSMPAMVQLDSKKVTDKVNQTNRERSRRRRLQE